jgi:hypothetical protein
VSPARVADAYLASSFLREATMYAAVMPMHSTMTTAAEMMAAITPPLLLDELELELLPDCAD